MNNFARTSLAVLALSVCFSAADAAQIWRIKGGATSMFFHHSNLEGLGISVGGYAGTINWNAVMEDQRSFAISGDSTLMFETQNGRFVRFVGGSIATKGGFNMNVRGRQISYQNFATNPNGEDPESDLSIYPTTKSGNQFKIDVQKPLVNFDFDNRRLNIAMMDLAISNSMATALRERNATGFPIGVINFDADVEFVSGDPNERPNDRLPNLQLTQDVGLSAMSGVAQVGRIGTYPNGTAGLAISTTSCGIGTGDIPWFAPMNVNHPVIVQNLYSLRGGRFEQIGEAYLKHGFLSTNSGGCGTCDHPGTGALLGPGCSDTYGTGNNSDRRYLGPRGEVNPLTGVWDCNNSLFSNFQPDCVDRRNTTTVGLDAVARRIEVPDQDLIGGANVVFEAYYITPGDINTYNQIAWRRATPVISGSNWTFSGLTAMTLGPAIMGWGDRQKIAEPRTDGDAIVAVKVINLGGGQYSYDYAVYNHTLDRKVRSFKIPIETGLNITNVQFRDIDNLTTNEWTYNYSNKGYITFQTGTPGSPNANPLAYGSVYNFRFTANIPPVLASNAELGLFQAGAFSSVNAEIDGPTRPQPIAVSGTINLQDWVGSPQQVTLELVPTDSSPTETVTVTPNGSGAYSFNTTLRGEFNVFAKASHWLRKSLGSPLLISSSAINSVNFSLVNGDVDGDNEVGSSDLSAVSSAFLASVGDPNYNANADLDGDGEVGSNDLSILSNNYLLSGD